jgi:hypothetical protein
MGKLPAGAFMKAHMGTSANVGPYRAFYEARLLKRPVESRVLIGVSTKESLVVENAHI